MLLLVLRCLIWHLQGLACDKKYIKALFMDLLLNFQSFSDAHNIKCDEKRHDGSFKIFFVKLKDLWITPNIYVQLKDL